MRKRRVIEIIRVSSNHQDVRRQRTDLARNREKFGLEVVRTLELVGQSGTTVLTNKQIQQVLADLKNEEVDGVSCAAIDRLFRPKSFDDFTLLGHFQRQHKSIWSTREGFVDPSTDQGYKTAADAAVEAEHERRRLLQRTWDGKEELRKEGLSGNGRTTIPRGAHFDRATGKWSYVAPDCQDVANMFRWKNAGDSYHTIADDRLGGRWSFEGVRRTLHNPIWIGLRQYPAKGRREEAFTRRVIDQDKQLISDELFYAVQRLMAGSKKEWHKAHGKHHTLSGLLRHSCGAKFYVRYSGKKKEHHAKPHDYYYCAKCGARGYRMDDVDAAVCTLISATLCQAAVLHTLLSAIVDRRPLQDDGRAIAQREVIQLEKRRVRVLDMYERGDIDRDQYIRRLEAVDRDLATARAAAAAQTPHPTIDTDALVRGLARGFARFASLPPAERMDLLRRAVKDIILDGATIPSLTLRGGFLGEILEAETCLVNSSTQTAAR